ncbi:hypothetical protein ABT174_38460 [Streptomyces sparsogenes]|uniref:hypothetical protein n=1 Tax=Streptomyces sparsogenes TaxID=67365 RepID=UPI00332CC4C5
MPVTRKTARMAVAASALVLGGAGAAAAQPKADGPVQRNDCDTAFSTPQKIVAPFPAGDIVVGGSCRNISG